VIITDMRQCRVRDLIVDIETVVVSVLALCRARGKLQNVIASHAITGEL